MKKMIKEKIGKIKCGEGKYNSSIDNGNSLEIIIDFDNNVRLLNLINKIGVK